MTELFLARAQEDELLGEMFRGADEHAAHIAGYFEANFGGSPAYLTERGDLSFVLGRHQGLNITEPQRSRWVQMMLAAAWDAGMPKEARVVFAQYLDQASRHAASYSHTTPRP